MTGRHPDRAKQGKERRKADTYIESDYIQERKEIHGGTNIREGERERERNKSQKYREQERDDICDVPERDGK